MLNQPQSEPQTLSPVIERLVEVHEKNQNKQKRAQNTNHSIVLQYEKFKKNYEQKNKQKQAQVLKRMSETKKNKIQFYKKQSLHVEKIIQKFKKQDKRRELNRLDMINKRNRSTHKRQLSEKSGQNSLNKTQNIEIHQRSSPRMSSSVNEIEQFYNMRYLRISQMCDNIRKKSIQKQEKAFENRKSIQEQSNIKQRNQAKLSRKLKAEQQFSKRQQFLIKKSVTKLQLSDKRNEQHSFSLTKKHKNIKQRIDKNIQEARKRRSDFQQKLFQRLIAIQKKSEQKQRKISTNKQNYMATTIQNKKNRRLQKLDTNTKKFSENMNQFNNKMSEMYKKDREQWGFLTGINMFKQVLIEKNVYENSQLALNK